MKHLPRSSPHLVHNETKSFRSIPSPHPVHDETKFWINTSTSPTRCYCKIFKMAIHIKSTILKLKNSRNMLEILFLRTLNMLNFKRLALIPTEMESIETKYFGLIPSPHQVHSCAIILVLDQYLHLTEYILVL